MIAITSLRKRTIKYMNHKLKQEYFNNLLINDAKRPKQLWKTLKTLVPNGKIQLV